MRQQNAYQVNKELNLELNWKLPAKKNEYTCGNNISRIYSENLWKLQMNQSQKLLVIN